MEWRGGTLVTDHRSGRPVLRKVALTIEAGPDRGLTRALDPGALVVGTGKDADVVLKDPRVSRRHCEVALQDDGVLVHDLGSRNGTLLDGARIERAIVRPGTSIAVGDTVMTFVAEDTAVDLGAGQRFGPLSARSPRMQELFALLTRAARSETTILLEGETGVGKDVFARAIHEASARRAGPFVVLDCGAVAPNLVSSELFGHKKGAFTGADADREGVFEAARGGTLFLDEIGELPLELQPTLLRVLENRQVRRVGDTKTRDVDVRIVAATNRSLAAEAAKGKFREDLYYRLAIVRVGIPPLRERRDDIPELVAKFLVDGGRKATALSAADIAALVAHDWPGNVRELKNVVARACALSGERLVLDLAGAAPRATAASTAPAPAFAVDDLFDVPLKEARAALNARFEEAYAQRVVARHDGNVTRAAEAAGVARNYLHRLLKKHGG